MTPTRQRFAPARGGALGALALSSLALAYSAKAPATAAQTPGAGGDTATAASAADSALLRERAIRRIVTPSGRQLVLINGLPASQTPLELITPDNVDLINFNAEPTVTARYGPAAADGLINIVTKQRPASAGPVIMTEEAFDSIEAARKDS